MSLDGWLVLLVLAALLAPINIWSYRVGRRRKIRNYTGPGMTPIFPGYFIGRLVTRIKGKAAS